MEQFYYNISDFYQTREFGKMFKLNTLHPFRILNMIVFLIDPILVPFFYTRIYLFRKRLNEKQLGLGENAITRRKQKNIVQMKFHLFTWIWESSTIILIISRPDLRLLYVLSISCGTPLFYFLGIEENRIFTWESAGSIVLYFKRKYKSLTLSKKKIFSTSGE